MATGPVMALNGTPKAPLSLFFIMFEFVHFVHTIDVIESLLYESSALGWLAGSLSVACLKILTLKILTLRTILR
jgi:hypothetical protein